MWLTNIKQAFKHIFNQKQYSLVIIIGLAVGLAASFLVYSFVFYEKSYDNFHEQGDQLYRIVVTNNQKGQDSYKSPFSYAPQGPVALEEVPEVDSYVRLMGYSKTVITPVRDGQDNALTVSDYYYADETFFDLFTFPLVQGDPTMVLKEPNTVVISESMAKRLFGSQSPIGEQLKMDGKYTWSITGVFEDIPSNSHLKFEMLFSLNTFHWIMDEANAWGDHSFFTYLLLNKGAAPNEAERKITSSYLKENRVIHQNTCAWELQPVSDAYLSTSDFTSKPHAFRFGDERIVYFLSLIAVLILCIGWINYINLSTAKVSEREKEILVRKTNGARKTQLMSQFFTETVLFNLIAIVMAMVIVALVFEWFKSAMTFNFSIWTNAEFWIVVGSVLLIGILMTGFISALSTSNFNPATAKYSISKPNSKYNFRNGLVIFQFIMIITLMVGVIIVNKQLQYLHDVDLGFQKEQVLVVNAPRVGFNDQEINKIDVLREELIRKHGIADVTASTSIPGERFGSGNDGPIINGQTDKDTYFRVGRVMPNYMDFFGIELAYGKGFGSNMETNNRSVIINKEAVKEFGYESVDDVLNKQAVWLGKDVTIIGVTDKFHQQSLHIEPEPTVFYSMSLIGSINYILVKTNTNNLDQAIASVEDKYAEFFPGNPFDYFFLDNFFDQQYKKDIAFQKLFSFFSIVAFLIGFVGLYGLTTFRIIKRTKEIGIRKVNGAKTFEIMAILNRDFARWVMIAFVVACPLAYYIMNKWLENFAYKTEISWWIFALAGIIALMIALLTVSVQSWKAARRNPVEALKYE